MTNRRYLLIDGSCRDSILHEELGSGLVDFVQLRLKNKSRIRLGVIAEMVAELLAEYDVPFILNDEPDWAHELGAAGVHLGQLDASPHSVRAKYGKDFVIGVTAKTVEQALRAQEDGANYLGCGAIFQSMTKPDAVRMDIELLTQICAAVQIPVYAIGGVTHENAHLLRDTGVHGIAYMIKD